MNYIASGVSLGVWSGVAAGMGAVFLPNMTFRRAALIGGGSVAGSAAVFGISMLAASIFSRDFYNGVPGSFENFLKNWSWVAVIPLVGVPYLSGVTLITGITLVGLGILGAALKAATVGILPDK